MNLTTFQGRLYAARSYPICNLGRVERAWWVAFGRDPFWIRLRPFWRLRELVKR